MEELTNRSPKEHRSDEKPSHVLQGGMLPTIAEMERWAILKERIAFDEKFIGRVLPR